MFDFYKDLFGNSGVKLISDFSSRLYDFICETRKNSKRDLNDNGGDNARIGSSGDCAKIGSSGGYAQIGSSGYYAKIDISGESSIGFACGYKSVIRAKKGTWISLAEYGKDNKGNYITVYAKSAQIGNKEYRDFSGKILNSKDYYILWKKEFYPVKEFDEILLDLYEYLESRCKE